MDKAEKHRKYMKSVLEKKLDKDDPEYESQRKAMFDLMNKSYKGYDEMVSRSRQHEKRIGRAEADIEYCGLWLSSMREQYASADHKCLSCTRIIPDINPPGPTRTSGRSPVMAAADDGTLYQTDRDPNFPATDWRGPRSSSPDGFTLVPKRCGSPPPSRSPSKHKKRDKLPAAGRAQTARVNKMKICWRCINSPEVMGATMGSGACPHNGEDTEDRHGDDVKRIVENSLHLGTSPATKPAVGAKSSAAASSIGQHTGHASPLPAPANYASPTDNSHNTKPRSRKQRRAGSRDGAESKDESQSLEPGPWKASYEGPP